MQEIAFANYIVQSLAINQAGHIFAGVQDVIYRSTDNGVNWTAVSNSMTNTTISSIVIDPTGQIFACAYPLYRSTDNGDTWVETGSGINHVYSIAFNSIGQLFLGTEYGVFRLTNNEEIWETIHLGFDGIHVRSVSITSGDKIFIGTDRGLFSSADNGNSWTESNSGLYNPTQSIFFDASTVDMATVKFGPNKTSVIKGCLEDIDGDGDLDLMMHFDNKETGITKTDTKADLIGKTFAGIDIKGSDSIKIVGNLKKEGIENAAEDQIPKTYSLLQNYPNPFNPSTTIQFSLPQEGFTTIKIYNSLGQEVAQLISQYLNSGNYSVEWNASDFSSGVYYYIINAGRFIETKKLLLTRKS